MLTEIYVFEEENLHDLPQYVYYNSQGLLRFFLWINHYTNHFSNSFTKSKVKYNNSKFVKFSGGITFPMISNFQKWQIKITFEINDNRKIEYKKIKYHYK